MCKALHPACTFFLGRSHCCIYSQFSTVILRRRDFSDTTEWTSTSRSMSTDFVTPTIRHSSLVTLRRFFLPHLFNILRFLSGCAISRLNIYLIYVFRLAALMIGPFMSHVLLTSICSFPCSNTDHWQVSLTTTNS
jgi:hypothetical protein